MLRMGKLTDYGIVLMCYLAQYGNQRQSAQSLSLAIGMPLPTVRKVLKALSQGGLLVSERGVHGGYGLSRSANAISVAHIITAIEGPIALTECVSEQHHCEQEDHCSVQTNWARINQAVFHALDEVKLADMLTTDSAPHSPIRFYPSTSSNKSELHG